MSSSCVAFLSKAASGCRVDKSDSHPYRLLWHEDHTTKEKALKDQRAVKAAFQAGKKKEGLLQRSESSRNRKAAADQQERDCGAGKADPP